MSVVLVYSPTCPHCVAIQQDWSALKTALRGVMPVREYEVGSLSATTHPHDAYARMALQTTQGVPHIFVAERGSRRMVEHTGPRDKTALLRFVLQSVRGLTSSSRRGGGT